MNMAVGLRSFTLARFIGAVGFAALLGGVGSARADVITFHDLADTITVEHVGTQPLTCVIVGESASCTLVSSRVNTAATRTAQARIFEAGSTTISDLFTITATNGSNILQFVFCSDPDFSLCPLINDQLPSIIEDGTPQLVVQYFGGSTVAIDSFFIQSDVNEVPRDTPEPASLALLGIGLLGLWRWRAQRRP